MPSGARSWQQCNKVEPESCGSFCRALRTSTENVRFVRVLRQFAELFGRRKCCGTLPSSTYVGPELLIKKKTIVFAGPSRPGAKCTRRTGRTLARERRDVAGWHGDLGGRRLPRRESCEGTQGREGDGSD